jgi:hypothetical protein
MSTPSRASEIQLDGAGIDLEHGFNDEAQPGAFESNHGFDMDEDGSNDEAQPGAFEINHILDTDEDDLAQIVQETWFSNCSQENFYDSDDEDESDIDTGNIVDPDSDLESGFEGKETHNGLEMEDLVDEDIQRIIAEFGA